MITLLCKPLIITEPSKPVPIMTPKDCRLVSIKQVKDNEIYAEFMEPVEWLSAPPIVINEKDSLN